MVVSLLTAAVVLTTFLISFPIQSQAAAPTFTVKWKAGQPTVVLIFTDPVSDGANPAMGLATADFTVAGTDALTISSISHMAGNQEVVLTLSGNLAVGGAGEVTIACAASSVFNFANEACGTSATDLNAVAQDTAGPTIVQVELVSPTTIFVELSEPTTTSTVTAINPSNFTLVTSAADTETITGITQFSDGAQITASGATTVKRWRKSLRKTRTKTPPTISEKTLFRR